MRTDVTERSKIIQDCNFLRGDATLHAGEKVLRVLKSISLGRRVPAGALRALSFFVLKKISVVLREQTT